MEVYQRIAKYLVDHGISQKFLADRIGISTVCMSNRLNGKCSLGANEFLEICKALEKDPNYFMEETTDA